MYRRSGLGWIRRARRIHRYHSLPVILDVGPGCVAETTFPSPRSRSAPLVPIDRNRLFHKSPVPRIRFPTQPRLFPIRRERTLLSGREHCVGPSAAAIAHFPSASSENIQPGNINEMLYRRVPLSCLPDQRTSTHRPGWSVSCRQETCDKGTPAFFPLVVRPVLHAAPRNLEPSKNSVRSLAARGLLKRKP
jgi:hypothetical protein